MKSFVPRFRGPAFLSLLIAVLCNLNSALAQNVNVFFVTKGEAYVQTSTTTPTTAVEFFFESRVDANSGTSTTASIQYDPPNGAVNNLSSGGPNDPLEFETDFISKASLDSAHPNGVYRFVISNSVDGQKTIDLTFPMTDAYPPVPRISNHDELIVPKNPSLPLSIQWDTIAGGTTDDFVQVAIVSGAIDADGMTVFSTPDPNQPNALNATQTSVIVPGRTLTENSVYTIELLVSKAVDFQAYDAAMFGSEPGGAAVFSRITLAQFSTTNATDITSYAVGKAKGYVQTNASSVQLDGDTPYFFSAILESTTSGSITAGTVQDIDTPGTVKTLMSFGGHEWEFEEEFATEAAMHAAYPDATYRINSTGTNDGSRTVDVALSGSSLPNAPQVSNFDDAQMIDPAQPFTLSWNSFTGGRANSFVNLIICENGPQGPIEVLRSGFWGAADMLPSTATSYTIPANLLQLGKTYEVELAFYDVSSASTTDYESGVPVPGVGAYASLTELEIKTQTPPAPMFANATIVPGTSVLQVDLQQTLPGQSYVIEATTDFTNWTTLLVTNVMTSTITIQDGFSLNQFDQRFYRAHIGSGSLSFSFNFLHFANGGGFSGGPVYTPAPAYPVAINGFSANVQAFNEPNPPQASQVLFTDPSSSFLVNSPADAQNSDASSGRFQTVHVSNPATGPAGNWSVNYNGIPIVFMVSDPDANNRLVIPLPSVNTSSGNITSIDWSYRAAGDGSDLGSAPGFMTDLQVQITTTGAGHNSPNLDTSTTSYTVPTTISWSTVTAIFLVYNDDRNNHYVVGYDGPVTGP